MGEAVPYLPLWKNRHWHEVMGLSALRLWIWKQVVQAGGVQSSPLQMCDALIPIHLASMVWELTISQPSHTIIQELRHAPNIEGDEDLLESIVGGAHAIGCHRTAPRARESRVLLRELDRRWKVITDLRSPSHDEARRRGTDGRYGPERQHPTSQKPKIGTYPHTIHHQACIPPVVGDLGFVRTGPIRLQFDWVCGENRQAPTRQRPPSRSRIPCGDSSRIHRRIS